MILDEIVENTRLVVENSKWLKPQSQLEQEIKSKRAPRGFAVALKTPGRIRIISELKKASPSGGLIRSDFDPESIAEMYENNGAAAVSILTDEKYFQGRLTFIERVKTVIDLPALRKDFMIDPYQFWEARAAGADCILLIVRILSDNQIRDFLSLTKDLEIDALVETHSASEIERALAAGAELLGINNRDLDTLEVDLDSTRKLRALVPDGLTLVSESGIKTADDIRRLRDWGVDAALIGESLMRAANPGALLYEFANA
ncbi:MAG: indole-3-glycerol phosphate synthase TrpC [Planctomycetota bacterium]|nr:indole-3-glycerol phosphate synthase TrpC [Planctomycetota bacterium]MDA1139460.1 indole-3-glycerol phosphate synthase TrpC [Planctomycetota bacterium]